MACNGCGPAMEAVKAILSINRTPLDEEAHRTSICDSCDYAIMSRRKPWQAATCSVCRCIVRLKVRRKNQRCPKEFW